MSQSPEPEQSPETKPSPASPCLGICLMDPRTGTCRGCLRTIEEIRCWYAAGAADKRRILERLRVRRAAKAGP